MSTRASRAGTSRRAVATVFALAAVAWALSAIRMGGMDVGPGAELGTLGWFAVTWLAMMSAMMLPALAPTLASWRSPGRERASTLRALPAGSAFLGGYLTVWALAGLAAYLTLHTGRELAGEAFAWRHGGRWLAVAMLAAAAVYQLTGAKRRSLARCRIPLADAERRSLGAATQAGLSAGLRCLASSWALIAALFALGAMSLVWMALVSILIVAERLAPLASPARVAAAPVLLVLAAGVAIAPASVPALTVPGSQAAKRAMMRMSGAGPPGAMPRPRGAMRNGAPRASSIRSTQTSSSSSWRLTRYSSPRPLGTWSSSW